MTVPIKAIEEEYWTAQYQTNVTGAGKTFWPEEGTGKFATEEDAVKNAKQWLGTKAQPHHPVVRTLHIVRRVEFGPEITLDDDSA